MLSENKKKLSCPQLEHFHTASGSDGLYVSCCVGTDMSGCADLGCNVGRGGWVRNIMVGFSVCVVMDGKERENASWLV